MVRNLFKYLRQRMVMQIKVKFLTSFKPLCLNRKDRKNKNSSVILMVSSDFWQALHERNALLSIHCLYIYMSHLSNTIFDAIIIATRHLWCCNSHDDIRNFRPFTITMAENPLRRIECVTCIKTIGFHWE